MTMSIIIFTLICISFSPLSYASYEYFIMAEQWAPAYCRSRQCSVSPLPSWFTIHGLWPANFTDPQPSTCPTDAQGATLKKGMVSGIAGLGNSWPNVEKPNNLGFWADEWHKHGTCSYSMFSQTKYFTLANKIWNGLKLVDILRQDGITPSLTGSYDREQIREAIRKRITLPKAADMNYPELRCTSELAEIRLCLNHNGDQYINCPNVGNCGPKIRWKP